MEELHREKPRATVESKNLRNDIGKNVKGSRINWGEIKKIKARELIL